MRFTSESIDFKRLGAFFRNIATPKLGGGEAAVYEENRRNGPSAGARMLTSVRAPSFRLFSGERRGERLGGFARSPYQGRRLPPAILKASRLPGRQAGRKDLPNISKESLGFAG